jgi:hypothetical protein
MGDLKRGRDVREFDGEQLNFADQPRWMPIETAPRDGSSFLIFVPYCVGWMDISGVGPIRFGTWNAERGEFTDTASTRIDDVIRWWAPFPTPPSDAGLVVINGNDGTAIDERDLFGAGEL